MPTFEAGESKIARATMTNPTAKGFDYTAELYLGLPKAATSGVVSFNLAAGEAKAVAFPVTMPGAEGTYPVYLDVFVGVDQVGAFQATEDVAVAISPAVDIGPIVWE